MSCLQWPPYVVLLWCNADLCVRFVFPRCICPVPPFSAMLFTRSPPMQYDSLDPLSLGNGDANYQRRTMGEWDSVCDVRGYGGFRSFKIRPKKLSRHGRQYVRWDNSEEPLFNMSNVSRLKSQSIRHSTAACREDSRDPVWTITSDMMERTQVVLNEKEEQVAFVQKSLKTLLLNAQFGKGSEVVIDIAPGVDQAGTCARGCTPVGCCGRCVGESPAALSCRPRTVLLCVGRVALVSLVGGGHALLLSHGCVWDVCQHHARSLSLLPVLFGCILGTMCGPYLFYARFSPPTPPSALALPLCVRLFSLCSRAGRALCPKAGGRARSQGRGVQLCHQPAAKRGNGPGGRGIGHGRGRQRVQLAVEWRRSLCARWPVGAQVLFLVARAQPPTCARVVAPPSGMLLYLWSRGCGRVFLLPFCPFSCGSFSGARC